MEDGHPSHTSIAMNDPGQETAEKMLMDLRHKRTLLPSMDLIDRFLILPSFLSSFLSLWSFQYSNSRVVILSGTYGTTALIKVGKLLN